ncbi:MAG: MerR family transcriptional regulator [Calditrichaeota bacterium]|nr:MerR family transcriptional regulator [Calditrichota bacterium]
MNQLHVKQLAKLAGITVRTLHYYDQIGLLKPGYRAESGYRYYNRIDLLRLQQILFYKEIGMPLKQIKEILDNPEFDLIASLELHRRHLTDQQERLQKLIRTIDKTIKESRENQTMINEEELYDGFSKSERKGYRQEVINKWGKDELEASEKRLKKLSKAEWEKLKVKGEEINKLLADLVGTDPASEPVQRAIDLHCQYIDHFRPVSEPYYRGLAKLYVEDQRFTAYYEKYRKGLADFIRQAIEIYCDNGLKIK